MIVKNIGFLNVSLHLITEAMEDPTKKLPAGLFEEIVYVLAKYDFISDRIILDFTECIKCEQKDVLHATLIDAGKRIQAKKELIHLQSKEKNHDNK